MIKPLTIDQAPLDRRLAEMRAVLEIWSGIYRQDDPTTLEAPHEAATTRSIGIGNAEARGGYLGVGRAPGADDYVAHMCKTFIDRDALVAAYGDDPSHVRCFEAVRQELPRDGNLR